MKPERAHADHAMLPLTVDILGSCAIRAEMWACNHQNILLHQGGKQQLLNGWQLSSINGHVDAYVLRLDGC